MPANRKPDACSGLQDKRSRRRFETLIRNTPRSQTVLPVIGMKRDACVVEPDSPLPGARLRALAWHELAIGAHTMDEQGY